MKDSNWTIFCQNNDFTIYELGNGNNQVTAKRRKKEKEREKEGHSVKKELLIQYKNETFIISILILGYGYAWIRILPITRNLSLCAQNMKVWPNLYLLLVLSLDKSAQFHEISVLFYALKEWNMSIYHSHQLVSHNFSIS